MDGSRVQRFDFQPIRHKPHKTAQGFLRVSGNLTRTGVLEYRRADGSIFRELRLPSEVFSAESLESLDGAPVTNGHRAMVGPENVADYQVGVVAKVGTSDQYVTGSLTIQRKDEIEKVEAGELVELSPGYTCTVEQTPGEYEGEHYDGIQRGIIYNHLAIGPRNWGRSGPEVSIKFDGMAETAAFCVGETIARKEKGSMQVKINLDGITFPADLPEALAPNFEAAVNKLRTDAADKAAKLEAAEGAIVAKEKEIADLRTKLDAATSPDAIQAAVTARVDLVERAKKIAPEVVTVGRSDREIKIDSLAAAGFGPEITEDKTDAFIDGLFFGIAKQEKAEKSGARSIGVSPEPVVKADDKFDADTARARMIERNRDAWKGVQ